MQPALNACVYIVDDDAIVRDAMAWLLRSRRLMSESFDSADAFEQMLNDKFPGTNAPVPTQAGCILLDVRMPGQSGLALFETLIGNGLAQTWPVIFLSGHADVPTAVDSVKRGAFDFCEKPFSDNALVDRVEQALALSQERLALHLQSAAAEPWLYARCLSRLPAIVGLHGDEYRPPPRSAWRNVLASCAR